MFVNKAGGFHSDTAEDKIILMFYALSSVSCNERSGNSWTMQTKNVGNCLPVEEEQDTRKLQYPQFFLYVEAF